MAIDSADSLAIEQLRERVNIKIASADSKLVARGRPRRTRGGTKSRGKTRLYPISSTAVPGLLKLRANASRCGETFAIDIEVTVDTDWQHTARTNTSNTKNQNHIIERARKTALT
jgi:hypothetical protein